jgi:hypothetical protein
MWLIFRNVPQRYRRATTAPREAEKDPSGIWHVCFSMHSSRGELEKALKILNPEDVISTTPHCGAVELFAKKQVINFGRLFVFVNDLQFQFL